MSNDISLTQRRFTEIDAERTDDLGFLDPDRTPKLVSIETILDQPFAWIVGPPWLGKSTVAGEIVRGLRLTPDRSLADRIALTLCGEPNAHRSVPPPWWKDWVTHEPARAVWLVDGVDEGIDQNQHLFRDIIDAIESAPVDHLRELRLLVFSRPYAELGFLRERLNSIYPGIVRRSNPANYWLARLDRHSAERLVGAEHFARILDTIQRNQLQTVAGLPIVLKYLAEYREAGKLSIGDVWRGIITALLGEPQTNPNARRFVTEQNQRFDAACRIAAILSLVKRETIRDYSPDSSIPTFGNLWRMPDNRLTAAAREACQTNGFLRLPELGAFRFARQNIQDWLTAFALERLPLPALRSALTTSDGKISDRLRESMRLIKHITQRPEVNVEIDRLSGGVLLPSDALATTKESVRQCIDQLEDLAVKSVWGLRWGPDSEKELGRLRTDGLSALLRERLRDPNRTSQAKKLLLDIAEATNTVEVADDAVLIVLDAAQPFDLRLDAMLFVAKFGGEAHLRELEVPIGESPAATEHDHRLRGIVVDELLKRGMWSTWQAVLQAPPRSPNVIDRRASLLVKLSKELTAVDARHLLPNLGKLYERHRGSEPARDLPEFLKRAIDLLSGEPLTRSEIDHLVDFAFSIARSAAGWGPARGIARRLRTNLDARRAFYERDAVLEATHPDGRALHLGCCLAPDDVRWLREQVVSRWATIPDVVTDLYRVAREAYSKNLITDAEWSQIQKIVNDAIPEHSAKFEERMRKYEREEAERIAEQKAAEESDPAQRSLSERLNGILQEPGLDDTERMHMLAYVCFAESVGLPSQAKGEWDELPEDVRRHVLDACKTGLELAEPTPIPIEDSFPTKIFLEGAAFLNLALSVWYPNWLSAQLITRWLSSALFSQTSDWSDIIRACWTADQPATEAVLTRVIESESRRSSAYRLRGIPTECWTKTMTSKVVEMLQSDKESGSVSRELMELILERSPESVPPIAKKWMAIGDKDDPRFDAAVFAYLVLEPSVALDILASDFQTRGRAGVTELASLWASRDTLRVEWEKWPIALIERLAGLLIRAVPKDDDAGELDVNPGPEHDLWHLRGQVIDFLLHRKGDPIAAEALDRLAPLDEQIREYIANYRASVKAGQLIPTMSSSDLADPLAPTLAEAVSIMDRSEYRLIRSSDDLFDAVLECLRHIENEIGYDLAMLYHPSAGKGVPRKHLHEDALQAYVRRRLTETLPQMVDEVKIVILREDEVKYRQRFDLRILAPCHGTRTLATVVVEIKWSTNAETKSSLVDQLGDRYLRGEGLRRGVFLVGWCGEWTPGDGTGVSNDVQQLRAHLEDQAKAYHLKHPEIVIEPFVMDARWSVRD